MQSRWQREKEKLVKTAQEMALRGLVTGTSGNASLRLEPIDGRPILAITPSQKQYESLKPEDIQIIDFEADAIEGELVPSSESLLHISIYKARPDVAAVLHTHSTYASVLAVAAIDIPPIIDEMAVFVGNVVKVAEYAFSGTEELAEKATEALGRNNAVILRNHGSVGVGRTLEEAMDVCLLVERGAQIFVHASLLGRVNQLSQEAQDTAAALFKMRFQSGIS